MKTILWPIHFPEGSPQGPWGVRDIGSAWYVVDRATGRAKRIGPAGRRLRTKTNYFDRALEEAHRRNLKEA